MCLELDSAVITTRALVVVAALQLATADVAEQCTKTAADAFADALANHVRTTHPEATIVPYDYSDSPHDTAFRRVQKAALFYTYAGWDNGRETEGASHELDHGMDRLDEALADYAKACLTAV